MNDIKEAQQVLRRFQEGDKLRTQFRRNLYRDPQREWALWLLSMCLILLFIGLLFAFTQQKTPSKTIMAHPVYEVTESKVLIDTQTKYRDSPNLGRADMQIIDKVIQ